MEDPATGNVTTRLRIRDGLLTEYADVYTPVALAAIEALAVYNREQKTLMAKRGRRRAQRFAKGESNLLPRPREHDCADPHQGGGTRASATSTAPRSRTISNVSGSREPGRPPSPTRH